jgi:hypothetical protein
MKAKISKKVKAAKMRQLAASWVANRKDLQSLWRREGKPKGKAWEKIAKPLWDRDGAIEEKLGPMLFEYAVSNNLGQHGTNYWHPEPDCYSRLRAVLGSDMNGQVLHRLIKWGWWETRGKAEHEAIEKSWDKHVRSMNDQEWSSYIKSYCASSPEGRGTKAMLVKLRAAYDAERKR